MVRQRRGDRLDAWLSAVAASHLSELQTFALGIERDKAAVQAGLTLPYSNGLLEGHTNRLKLIKRSMYDIVGECLASSKQSSKARRTGFGTRRLDQPGHRSYEIERCGSQQMLEMSTS